MSEVNPVEIAEGMEGNSEEVVVPTVKVPTEDTDPLNGSLENAGNLTAQRKPLVKPKTTPKSKERVKCPHCFGSYADKKQVQKHVSLNRCPALKHGDGGNRSGSSGGSTRGIKKRVVDMTDSDSSSSSSDDQTSSDDGDEDEDTTSDVDKTSGDSEEEEDDGFEVETAFYKMNKRSRRKRLAELKEQRELIDEQVKQIQEQQQKDNEIFEKLKRKWEKREETSGITPPASESEDGSDSDSSEESASPPPAKKRKPEVKPHSRKSSRLPRRTSPPKDYRLIVDKGQRMTFGTMRHLNKLLKKLSKEDRDNVIEKSSHFPLFNAPEKVDKEDILDLNYLADWAQWKIWEMVESKLGNMEVDSDSSDDGSLDEGSQDEDNGADIDVENEDEEDYDSDDSLFELVTKKKEKESASLLEI